MNGIIEVRTNILNPRNVQPFGGMTNIWLGDADMSILSKKCTKCGETKPLSEFHKDKNLKDGFAHRCKACAIASAKKHYQANPEAKRAYTRAWSAANREKKRENDKRYYLENIEKIKAKVKEYYLNHLEEWKVNRKRWLDAHPEYKKETRRKYEERHPGWVLEKTRRRRARKKANGGNITAQEWQELKEFYNHTCLCCKRSEPEIKLTLDHIVPLSVGGSHSCENAQPLCMTCNRNKGAKIVDYR